MNRTQAQKLWLCCRSNCHLCLKKCRCWLSNAHSLFMQKMDVKKISHQMQPFKETLPVADENCCHRAHGRSLPLNLQAAKELWALCSARKLGLRISVLSGIICNLSFGSLATLNAGMLSDKTFTFLGTRCHSTRGASVNRLTGKMFALTLDSNNKKCCKEAWFDAGLINQV